MAAYVWGGDRDQLRNVAARLRAGRVSLNGVAWNPRENPVLSDALRATLLDAPLDFSTARLVVRQARDMAVLMPEEDGPGIVIHFADNPNGAALVDLSVIFEGR